MPLAYKSSYGSCRGNLTEGVLLMEFMGFKFEDFDLYYKMVLGNLGKLRLGDNWCRPTVGNLIRFLTTIFENFVGRCIYFLWCRI